MREKIECPYCGYKMPIEKDQSAESHGLWVKCKGRNCGKVFEIKVTKTVK